MVFISEYVFISEHSSVKVVHTLLHYLLKGIQTVFRTQRTAKAFQIVQKVFRWRRRCLQTTRQNNSELFGPQGFHFTLGFSFLFSLLLKPSISFSTLLTNFVSVLPGTVSFARELCQGVLPGSVSFGAVCFRRFLTNSHARVSSRKKTVNAYDGVANGGNKSSIHQ